MNTETTPAVPADTPAKKAPAKKKAPVKKAPAKKAPAKPTSKAKAKAPAPAKKKAPATDKVLFTFRIEPDLLKELDKLATKRKVTVASIVRDQMASYVERNKKLGRM